MSSQFDHDAMFSRPSKKSHISTIEYEIGMLHFSLDWLVKRGVQHRPEQEIFMALECFLLHYRNLVSFLSGKGGSKGDLSMAAPTAWAPKSYDPKDIDSIRQLAVPAYEAHSGDISTYLAHCTQQRYEQSKKWQPSKMYDELLPAIMEFEKLAGQKETAAHMSGVLGDTEYGTTSMKRYSVLMSPDDVVFVRGTKKD